MQYERLCIRKNIIVLSKSTVGGELKSLEHLKIKWTNCVIGHPPYNTMKTLDYILFSLQNVSLRQCFASDGRLLNCSGAFPAQCTLGEPPVPCDRWMDECVDGWMRGWVDLWMNRWVDEWIDGQWVDGWMEGFMEGWMDGHKRGWICGDINRWMDHMRALMTFMHYTPFPLTCKIICPHKDGTTSTHLFASSWVHPTLR